MTKKSATEVRHRYYEFRDQTPDLTAQVFGGFSVFKPITLLNKHSFFCPLIYSSSCLLLFAILEASLKETASTGECVQYFPGKMQDLCTSYVKTQKPNRCLTIQERTWREV